MKVGTGFDLAIDELYETGWVALDTTGCRHHDDGRPYPDLPRVHREFVNLKYELHIRHVQLFDCFRAEWTDQSGNPAGAVVGGSETEAAIYALAQLRKNVKAGINP